MVHALSIGLKKVIGVREPGQDVVAQALRLAVDRAEIEQSPLWAALRAWEGRSLPFVVLG